VDGCGDVDQAFAAAMIRASIRVVEKCPCGGMVDAADSKWKT
jgi:hypothetical protein